MTNKYDEININLLAACSAGFNPFDFSQKPLSIICVET